MNVGYILLAIIGKGDIDVDTFIILVNELVDIPAVTVNADYIVKFGTVYFGRIGFFKKPVYIIIDFLIQKLTLFLT